MTTIPEGPLQCTELIRKQLLKLAPVLLPRTCTTARVFFYLATIALCSWVLPDRILALVWQAGHASIGSGRFVAPQPSIVHILEPKGLEVVSLVFQFLIRENGTIFQHLCHVQGGEVQVFVSFLPLSLVGEHRFISSANVFKLYT